MGKNFPIYFQEIVLWLMASGKLLYKLSNVCKLEQISLKNNGSVIACSGRIN